MTKPQIKSEVAISWVGNETTRFIHFYASPDAADDFRQFGAITQIKAGHYTISVDSRYDFNEAVEYIRGYSQPESESEPPPAPPEGEYYDDDYTPGRFPGAAS